MYIAELDQDIDDLFAILYLKRNNVLNCVVLDPYPKEKQGLEILNPKFATNEMIQTLQENYENLLKILEEKSSKNEYGLPVAINT